MSTEEPAISIFVCGAKCSAGGTEQDGGHVFDVPFETETMSGACCNKCGLSNIDYAMMVMP